MKTIRQAIKANDKGSSFLEVDETSKALQHFRTALNHLNETCKSSSSVESSSSSAGGITDKTAVITVTSKPIRLGSSLPSSEHQQELYSESFNFQVSNNSTKTGLRRVKSVNSNGGPLLTMRDHTKSSEEEARGRTNKGMRRAKSVDVDGTFSSSTDRSSSLTRLGGRSEEEDSSRAPRHGGRRTAAGGGGSVEAQKNKEEDDSIVMTMEQHQFCSAVLIFNTALTLHQKAAGKKEHNKKKGAGEQQKAYHKALVFYGEAKNLLKQTRLTAGVMMLEQHRQIQADSFRILQAIMKNQVDIYHRLKDLSNVKLIWEELADLVKENHFVGMTLRRQQGGRTTSPVPRSA